MTVCTATMTLSTQNVIQTSNQTIKTAMKMAVKIHPPHKAAEKESEKPTD